MPTPYDDFIKHVREIGMIDATGAVLEWDAEVNMPENGLAQRAEQLSFLAAMAHERRTHPRLGEWLAALDGRAENDVQLTNLREMRRAYDRAVKIPAAIVERIAHVSAHAKDAWAKARKESAFAMFAPHLKELLDLKRQVADAVGFDSERYDALLDEFEPGATAAEVGAVFDSLRGPLADFVRRLADAPRKPDPSILARGYPIERQKLWSRQCAMIVGFDFKSGRIDESTHPFCSGFGPGDVRLTTRYHENFLPAAMFGTLHEAGHGLYEQGLPLEHAFTPRGQAASLGIHESQSRMWENFVGRGRPFWERYYEQCRLVFHEALSDVTMDQFLGAINTVSPSLIRVEADEVTYNLHIILRFEIERDLLENRISVSDLPAAWNEKIGKLLGVTPKNDAEGCLQDIHWSMGAFGYFPTYALGNLYAAQFFESARTAMPDLDDRFRRGDFGGLLSWLRKNIHEHGMRHRPSELVRNVTGSALSIKPFMNYIHGKFAPIYGLDSRKA